MKKGEGRGKRHSPFRYAPIGRDRHVGSNQLNTAPVQPELTSLA